MIIQVDGKTYRISVVDTCDGQGPRQLISVQISTGPGGVARSHFWRPVPRDGQTWREVLAQAQK